MDSLSTYLGATDERNQRKIANRNYYSSNQSDGQDYINYIDINNTTPLGRR